MRRGFSMTMALCLGFLACATMTPARGQENKATKGQVTGVVRMINKATSTLTVRKGTTDKEVVFNADTKWSYGDQADAKAASFDQLKEGWYINCGGTYDGPKLVAKSCRFREAK